MSRTILIVDDDREVQRYLTDSLEAQGWRVIGEKDGEWALKTFQSRDIDAVILDILIPVVNGFQVAEAIRKQPRGEKVGIVMLTGIYRGASHRAEAIRRYGLLDYLDKPVEAGRVVDLLLEHFARLPAEEPAPVPPAQAVVPKPRSPSRLADAAQRREKREVEKATEQLQGGAAALRGNLKRISFPKLLHQLYVRRATGAVFLLREKIKKIVYLKEGHPIYIKSNLLNECLGRVLVRERMITSAECEDSLKKMKASNRQQGTVLIEMGVISPHNLKYALELQLQIKLFDIFSWPDGEYQFKDDAKLPNEVIALDLPNGAIILEGIRRTYDEARLQSALAPYMSSYLMPAPDPSLRFQEMPLEDDERAVIDEVDGTRTLKEHLAEPRLGPLRTQQLFFAMLCTGVIEPTETPSRERILPRDAAAVVAAAHEARAARGRSSGEPAALPPPPRPSVAGPLTRPPAPPQRGTDVPGRERLAANLLSLRQQDHFGALGLPLNATELDVERAYEERARDYHPDRFRQRSEDTRVIAREIFDRLSESYRVLSDPATRETYLVQLRRGEAAPAMDAAGRALAADRYFRSGEELLRQRRFAEAAAAFEKAAELVPEAGEYHAFFGWSTFQANTQSGEAREQAHAELRRGVEYSPRVDRTHLFLGYFLNQVGKTSLAEREFELAIQCNPDCAEALRELRLINARRTRQGLSPGAHK
jgi:DNA-binding response OmpR family regulator/tetratricopeptide (TPR) repeat protein